MKKTFGHYVDAFEHVAIRREEGIIELRFHNQGGPLVWGAAPQEELGDCFAAVARDAENQVVIITGTGDRFCADLDDSWVGEMTPSKWDRIYSNGKRLLQNLLAIEVPVIAAINGPATIHAEVAVLSDIVLASTTTYFKDAPHFRYGTVPSDGVHVVWPLLIGPNRARYFLLTGQIINVEEAQRLGVVNEIHSHETLLKRAWELAHLLCAQPDTTLRYTREVFVHPLRKLLLENVGYGLALEGLGAYRSWPR